MTIASFPYDIYGMRYTAASDGLTTTKISLESPGMDIYQVCWSSAR